MPFDEIEIRLSQSPFFAWPSSSIHHPVLTPPLKFPPQPIGRIGLFASVGPGLFRFPEQETSTMKVSARIEKNNP